MYEKNADTRMYPASTTKIMTAILTLENCELTDTAVASHEAVFSVPVGYSHANIQEGEELTIEQLLNVLLIPSANEAAFVLAEHIAGSVEAFSDMMNEKAKELGCTNTHFVNPNGIHDENHYSTAHDLALMGKYAMQFDTFRDIVSKTSCSLPTTNKYDKEDRLFNTTIDLIRPNYSDSPTNYYYEYATGAKTGYTDAAQNCIVATATKNDVSLIAVVLHGERTEDGRSERALDCINLFNYGFDNFSFQPVITNGSIAENITISDATKDSESLDLLYASDISAYLPNNYDLSSLEIDSTISQDIFAPIAKDTILGTATFTINDINYSCNLIASHDVYKSEFVKTILELLLILVILILFSRSLKLMSSHKSARHKKKKKKKNQYNRNSIDNFYPTYRNKKRE